MFESNNPVLLILLFALAWIWLNWYKISEGFVTNGLGEPQGYCEGLTYVYYDPKNPDSESRKTRRMKVCNDARNGVGYNIVGRRA